MKHKIGLISATCLGISSIIGSGWLFSAYKAANVAGPASILAWIVGALLILLLAFCFSEVASLYPKRGLSAVIATLSHNRYFGFSFAIASWLGVVAVISLEADGTIQYLITLFPTFRDLFFANEQLSKYGLALSVGLVIFYCFINFWGVRSLAKTNNILTVLKIIIPIIVIMAILSVAFHPHNFKMVGNSFMPYGVKSIFSAILNTGIIISFNGFQTAIAFSSEIKNPGRILPLSLTIAILFCMIIYVLLEVMFIGAIPEKMLAQGWSHLLFFAPIVQLSMLLGLGMLSSIIYFGATISPSGTAIAYVGSSSRMFTAMSRQGQVPQYFNHMHPIHKISRRSLIFNMLLAIIFVFSFKSWGQLAEILSLLHVISYLPIPIALIIFREQFVASQYPFRLWGGKVIALFLFVTFTYLMILGSIRAIATIIILFTVFQSIFIIINNKTISATLNAMKQSYLPFLYFFGLLGLAYLYPEHSHLISLPFHLSLVLAFSLIIFFVFIFNGEKSVEKLKKESLFYVEP